MSALPKDFPLVEVLQNPWVNISSGDICMEEYVCIYRASTVCFNEIEFAAECVAENKSDACVCVFCRSPGICSHDGWGLGVGGPV